ncbi:MAG: amidohydrolase family protein [Planctomycetes bacterium]|nr:amidohydrolase family protein [Planctomycetota bacterium]
MIVDCHTHIDLSVDASDIANYLAAAENVDACIALGCSKPDHDQVNEALGKFVAVHADKVVGFGVIDPTEKLVTADYLTRFTEEWGLQGFVLYCSACGFHPTHSDAMTFYQAVSEMGLPVFFHNGDLDSSCEGHLAYAQPFLLDEVAKAFPQLKIIVGSMGIPFMDQTIAVLARHENVFADLTIRPTNVWQTYNIVMAAHEQGVMGKLVFGSGYPIAESQTCIETLLGFNNLMADTNLPTVPRGSIRAIVERNSLELLSIDYSRIQSKNAQVKTDDKL